MTFGDRVTSTLEGYVWGRGSLVPSMSEPNFIATETSYQTKASAAQGPTGTMSVWFDRNTDAYARFFATDGAAHEPVRLTSPLFSGRHAVVARNDGTFAVAWLERRFNTDRFRVLLLRFDANGVQLDAEPLVIYDQTLAVPEYDSIAIAAETDGFRLAFEARPVGLLATSARPEVSVFTTHIGARATTFAEPAPLTPNYIRAIDANVVSDGADSMVIWRQGIAISSAMLDVYAQRYVSGVATGAPFLLGRACTIDAAAHAGEVLLAFGEKSDVVCTKTQRFAFNGTPLSTPSTLGCQSAYFTDDTGPSAVWDNGSWWVASIALQVTHVHELNADGTYRQTWRFFSDELPAESARLVPTGRNPSAVYIRVDPNEDFIERAFLRTFPWPKGRAARH